MSWVWYSSYFHKKSHFIFILRNENRTCFALKKDFYWPSKSAIFAWKWVGFFSSRNPLKVCMWVKLGCEHCIRSAREWIHRWRLYLRSHNRKTRRKTQAPIWILIYAYGQHLLRGILVANGNYLIHRGLKQCRTEGIGIINIHILFQ